LQIDALVNQVLDHLHLGDSTVDLSFVTEDEITELNEKHRGLAKPTDVLSFPQFEWQEPVTSDVEDPYRLLSTNTPKLHGIPTMLGDIILSPEVAQRNAEKIPQSLDREVAFLITHGVLHLCGHDHVEVSEEEAMLKEQRLIMAELDKGPAWENLVGRLEA